MDLDIFNIQHNTIKPEVTRILLSVPFVDDTFFNKAVIYLVSHEAEGSVGYILNKSLPIKLHEIIDDIPNTNFPVHIGGPVANTTLNMVHSLGKLIPDSDEVGRGLYWGGDFEEVKNLIADNLIPENSIRFFLGYVGWGPNQLMKEYEEDSWLVTNIKKPRVMTEYDEKLWERLLSEMGDKYKAWANFPSSPSLN